MHLFVTGGAGFIGANFVLTVRAREAASVVTLDRLTYAGNLESLADLNGDKGHTFFKGDIGDRELFFSLLREHRPRAIINFAAESEGVSPDDVVERLLEITPTKEDELTSDARFQKIFAS